MNKTTIKKTDKLVTETVGQLEDAGFKHVVLYYDDGEGNGSTMMCGAMPDVLVGAGIMVSQVLRSMVEKLESSCTSVTNYKSAIMATKEYKKLLDKRCDETIEALKEAELDASAEDDDDEDDEDNEEPLASGVIAINSKGKTSKQVAKEVTEQIMKMIQEADED